MPKKEVSIITPSYKSERFISQTIESVLAQTYQNWEMIIVDDVSPDNSNKIIEEYIKQDSRIKLIKLEKNSGPAIARNRAIEEAQGRYIAFLDADDLWMPEKLEKQIKFMTDNDLAFTYSSYDLIDEDGNDLGSFVTKEFISYEGMLKTCSVGCLTAIYDTKKLGKVYMPNILKRQDYGLWLKILKEIKTTKGMLEPLATYRILKNSVSSNKIKAAQYQWKIYREVEKLNIFQSVYYFIQYAYHGVMKYK
jgi:glycosyltransferase involved in cell wall biosynthesis